MCVPIWTDLLIFMKYDVSRHCNLHQRRTFQFPIISTNKAAGGAKLCGGALKWHAVKDFRNLQNFTAYIFHGWNSKMAERELFIF
jgi:hypothetical protein